MSHRNSAKDNQSANHALSFFKVAFHQNSQMMMLLNHKMRIITCNKAMTNYLLAHQKTIEPLISGFNPHWIHHYSLDQFFAGFDRIQGALNDPRQSPYRFVSHLGNRLVELSISIVIDSENNYLGHVATLEDISEQTIAAKAQQANQQEDEMKEEVLSASHSTQELRYNLDQMTTTNQRINQVAEHVHEVAMKTSVITLNAALDAIKLGQVGDDMLNGAMQVQNIALRCIKAVSRIKSMTEKNLQQLERSKQLSTSSHGAWNRALMRAINKPDDTDK